MKERKCLEGYAEAVASPEPAPGGGSVAAVCGALAAALARMVASITLEKKERGADLQALRKLKRKADSLQDSLLRLAEMDSEAYRAVVKAFKAPKGTEAQRKRRSAMIQRALIHASDIPLKTMENCLQVLQISVEAMEKGSKVAFTDAGSAALVAHTALKGAALNVEVNIESMKGKDERVQRHRKLAALLRTSSRLARRADKMVQRRFISLAWVRQ